MPSIRTFTLWAGACAAGILALAGCTPSAVRPVGPDFQQIVWLRAELACQRDPDATDQAREQIEQSEERIAETVRGLVDRARKADEALPDAVRRGGPSRNAALFSIAKALALIGDMGQARRATERIPDDELRGKVYATMASWHLVRGDLAEAISLAEKVSDNELAEGLHVELAEACARADRVAEAERRAATYAASAKLVAYISIARGQAAAGRRDGAVKALAQARKIAAAQPEITSDWRAAKPIFLKIIVVEQAKLGDVASARATAALITDTAQAGRALAAVIAAECTREKFQAALAIRAAAPTSSSDPLLDAALAQVRFFAGQRTQARQMLNKARQAADGITDAENRQEALRAIAAAQRRIGDFVAARETLAAAAILIPKAPYAKRNALSHHLALAQCRAGDLAGATATAGLITSGLKRGRALSAVAEARGDLALAEALDWQATAQHDLDAQVFTDLHGYLESRQQDSPESQVNTLAHAARVIAYALNFFQERNLKWNAKRRPESQ